ncbi:MAG TPA: hypothetical protein VK550_13550 [Polyangiaceae bacterium]|nr:hypothetical protein [Polyangiaceae bacterium]
MAKKKETPRQLLHRAFVDYWFASAPDRPGSVEVATILDALGHALDHDDIPGLKQLAKAPHAYLRNHECWTVWRLSKAGRVKMSDTPTIKDRHEAAEELLRAVARRQKVNPDVLASWAVGWLLMNAQPAGFGEKAKNKDVSELRKSIALEIAKTRGRASGDAENQAIAILVGWGMPRAKARNVYKYKYNKR